MKHFTNREQEVIDLILKEYSSARIADELHISERTVESHRKSIYSKAGVSSVVGLVKYVIANQESNLK